VGAIFGGGGRVLMETVVVAAGFDGGGLVVCGAGWLGVAFGDEAWVAGFCGLLWALPKSSAQETKSVLRNIILTNSALATLRECALYAEIVITIYPQEYIDTLRL
jgi:hypothetical protein